MQETQQMGVQSLGQEDPLEKVMATPSSSLAWEIPWTEEGAWKATVHGVAKGQMSLSNWTQHSTTPEAEKSSLLAALVDNGISSHMTQVILFHWNKHKVTALQHLCSYMSTPAKNLLKQAF